MRLRSLLAATLVTVWLPFNVALSCVCSSPTFAYAREYSIAVFSGKVIEVSADTVLFEVKEVWKGEVQKKYTLYIIEHSTCDFRFKRGENYLVYAKPYVDRETGEIKPYTHQCTRTSGIEYAKEDLRQLGEGKPPAPMRHIKPTAKPNNGMHPTRNNAALIIKGNSGRVMPGVRLLLNDG